MGAERWDFNGNNGLVDIELAYMGEPKGYLDSSVKTQTQLSGELKALHRSVSEGTFTRPDVSTFTC